MSAALRAGKVSRFAPSGIDKRHPGEKSPREKEEHAEETTRLQSDARTAFAPNPSDTGNRLEPTWEVD